VVVNALEEIAEELRELLQPKVREQERIFSVGS